MDRTWNPVARGIVCTAIVLSCANALWAVEFAGGTGEPNDPHQITTAEQLVEIGSSPNLAGRHFILMADVDLPGLTWPEPVIAIFTGTLDGNGHAIQGLVARGVGIQGLFGQIADTGRVINLNLIDFDLTGANGVGGLAAYNYGTVCNCTSTGRILSATPYAGGLVGSNNGTISGSSSAAEVTGYSAVGGLAGDNQGGIIINCRSTGFVFGSRSVGGLVGTNAGIIRASYSQSDTMASYDLGGLAGSNAGYISSCYSTGTVVGSGGAGGLVGNNYGRIASCYSIAGVTGQGMSIGGLAGSTSSDPADKVTNSFHLASADGGGRDNMIGTPLTSAQMKQRASFASWPFWGTDADGIDGRWFMPADSPPVLAWQTEITGLKLVPDVSGLPVDRARAMLVSAGFVPGTLSYDFHRSYPADFAIHADPATVALVGGVIGLVLSAGTSYDWADNPGSGTEADPYQIQTAGQLESLGDHPELWDRHFVLTAELDMVGRVYLTPLIAPHTGRMADDFQGTVFTGVLDGQGHTICNLMILAESSEYVGLFGMVGQAGVVRSLHLREAVVRTPSSGTPTRSSFTSTVGVLAGRNEGTFADCSVVAGILIGRNRNDGLVGANQGSIVNCLADITIVSISTSVR